MPKREMDRRDHTRGHGIGLLARWGKAQGVGSVKRCGMM